jgi:hypothetical protein
VGVGAVKPLDLIRDPVTMISVRAVASGSEGAGAWVAWALAVPADTTIAIALVASNTFKKGDPPRIRPKALIPAASRFSLSPSAMAWEESVRQAGRSPLRPWS